MKCKWLFLSFFVTVAVAGCDGGKVTIVERILPQRNPATYEFNASIGAVKDAINEARGEKWRDAQKLHQRGQLAWKGDGNLFAMKASKDPGADDFAYLYGMGDEVGTSRVYLKDGKELTYYADFKIRLTPTDASKTRVEVIPQNSQVLAGTEWHPYARAGVFVEVDPTSIEEYQILLDIGKQLGVQDMPKLITPDLNSPTRKIKKPRSH